jgi:anti-sigma regulatory factor (Ser/Thr protein kinase)
MQRSKTPLPPTNNPILLVETMRAPAEHAGLDALHPFLEHIWTQTGQILPEPPDTHWWLLVCTAMAEIAANIVHHAYPAGHAPGVFHLRVRLYADRVEGCYTDRGVVFRELSYPPPISGDDLMELPEGGMGLSIARTALDHLHYRRTGAGTNVWRLVKRFPARILTLPEHT